MAANGETPANVGANTQVSHIVPASALRHLEPHPGGFWSLVSQLKGTYTIAYMWSPTDVLYYTMHTCTDEDQVRKNCEKHIYTYNAEQSNDEQVPERGPAALIVPPAVDDPARIRYVHQNHAHHAPIPQLPMAPPMNPFPPPGTVPHIPAFNQNHVPPFGQENAMIMNAPTNQGNAMAMNSLANQGNFGFQPVNMQAPRGPNKQSVINQY